MRVIRLHELGPAENLVLEELPDLEPGPGPMPVPSLPTIPGREVAGVVDRVGTGVHDGWIGRRVVAHLGPVPGGYAELGAHLVVDHGQDGWERQVRASYDGVTVVYDGVGGAVGRTSLELLRPGGRLVMFGYSSGTPTRLTTADLVGRGITAGWSLGPRMTALPGGIPGLAFRALERVAAGRWRPLLSTYPLGEAARAHADLEGRRALGKVVLEPATKSVAAVGPHLQTVTQEAS